MASLCGDRVVTVRPPQPGVAVFYPFQLSEVT
jgi:hypothetical protein